MSIIGDAGTDYLYPRRDDLRPILETALDAVVVMKSDGIVADWNDRAAAVFGWSREEAVGRVMADLVIPERYREAHRKGLRRYLESGKGEVVGRRIEVSGLRKNGEEFLVELSISPIQDRENILFIGFLRDITELQALRLARAELGRGMRRMAMGEMAASIAHEIKQPLAAISANGNAGLRWLTRATPDIERACDVLKRIVSDTQHASEVIDGIRSMFKNEGQAKTMQDVNELIREALTLVRTEVENQHVSICTELSVELPQVPANQIQLRQVMVNLITNAVDAMSAVTNRARVLRIKTEEHKLDGVLITVEDSGVGIEPQNLDRIFDTFFTTKSQGMGMGLSICRSIVESHEGHLSVAAAQPHGSIFHVSLPTGTIRPKVKPES
ncbi:MAG TPA: PAS domain S-box protein [Xanthobacteraceae bacterium]|nr:PAS domain S-box protein [Xanthobacteraceae bacterium]